MNGPSAGAKPMMQKQTQITIKQVPASEKSKKEGKKSQPTKEEFKELAVSFCSSILLGPT